MKLENKQLGTYRLLSLINRGGMAEVWLATQLTLNREVAVKVMSEVLEAEDPNHYVERFSREARAVAQLDQPNILPIIDYGSAEGYLYLVTPYVRGGSLQAHLEQETFSRRRALDIFGQVLDGVKYAHQHGVIHRDLKPGNILLHTDGRAVIGDFGVAKIENDSLSLTQNGVVLGSPDYMAPEQFMGYTDYRSDLYSMGVILYQLLSGRVPYTGNTPWEIGMHHLHDPLPLPQPFIPKSLELFLTKALQKNLDARFANAGEMSLALQKAVAALTPQELQFRPPLPNGNQKTVVFPTKIIQPKLEPIQILPKTQPGLDAIAPFSTSLNNGTLEEAGLNSSPEKSTSAELLVDQDRVTAPTPPAPNKAAFVPATQFPAEAALPVITTAPKPTRKLPVALILSAALLLLLAIGVSVLFVLLNSDTGVKSSPQAAITATVAPTSTIKGVVTTQPATASQLLATATSKPAATTTSKPAAAPATTTVATTTVATTGSAKSSLKVTLNAANGTGASGTGQITDNGDGTITVVVTMVGLGAGQHGVHIHTGTCATPGALKYDLNGIQAGPDGTGTSTTTIKADFATISGGNYYLDLPNYTSGGGAYTASCGDITG